MTKVSIIQPRTNRVSVNEQERNTIRSIGLAGGGGGGGADVGPAYGKANAAFAQANTAFVQANAAFVQANTANVLAFRASANAAAAFAQANNASDAGNIGIVNAGAAFDKANSANLIATSSFNKANTVDAVSVNTTAAFAKANNAEVVAVAAFAKANTAVGNAAQVLTTSGPTFSVNYSLSNYAIINLAHNVTAFSVTGWPTVPARLTLEIRNTGAFNITFPTGYLALGGQPVLTLGAGKKDVIVLTTAETGANVFVHVVGQNYILL